MLHEIAVLAKTTQTVLGVGRSEFQKIVKMEAENILEMNIAQALVINLFTM